MSGYHDPRPPGVGGGGGKDRYASQSRHHPPLPPSSRPPPPPPPSGPSSRPYSGSGTSGAPPRYPSSGYSRSYDAPRGPRFDSQPPGRYDPVPPRKPPLSLWSTQNPGGRDGYHHSGQPAQRSRDYERDYDRDYRGPRYYTIDNIDKDIVIHPLVQEIIETSLDHPHIILVILPLHRQLVLVMAIRINLPDNLNHLDQESEPRLDQLAGRVQAEKGDPMPQNEITVLYPLHHRDHGHHQKNLQSHNHQSHQSQQTKSSDRHRHYLLQNPKHFQNLPPFNRYRLP
jgi:hypothetical protein